MKPIKFTAVIFKIGINPLVDIPDRAMNALFKQAGKNKGPIPVNGTVNGKDFIQHVVKYRGAWRLYLYGVMRRAAGIDVGDTAHVEFMVDTMPRIVTMHELFAKTLEKHPKAKSEFLRRTPSRQKDINRYLNSMKTEASLLRNIDRVIAHLSGKNPKVLSALMQR
ncbi:MAG TPA: YdeI/OmpD-associated family protein [Candidatus Kapabacteria bacterium]|nr:YdeI/OmpD-associated family protein [Candidatus Kapabacteria bacterium]